MPELMAAVAITPIDYRGVPAAFKGKVSAICRSKAECEDLVRWYGSADFCPFLPALLLIPGAYQQIAGWGLASAAEMRDQAVAVWEIITDRLAKTGSVVDFDALREKHGLMRREDVDAATREAFTDRIRRHKANPITDPPRLPRYVRVNEKTVHPITHSLKEE